MDEYHDYKEDHIYLSRRERQIKNGWRHGITGLFDARQNDVFYKDNNESRNLREDKSKTLNAKRLQDIQQCFGTSGQIAVGSPDFKRTTSHMHQAQEVVHDIDSRWKRKGIVSYRPDHQDTFKRMFMPASNVDRNNEDGCMRKIRIERSLKLRQEDTRGRASDLISNVKHEDHIWIDSFQDQKD